MFPSMWCIGLLQSVTEIYHMPTLPHTEAYTVQNHKIRSNEQFKSKESN
jgi:hypothetical protein